MGREAIIIQRSVRSIVRERYYQLEEMQRERERLWPHVWLMVCRSTAVGRGPSTLELGEARVQPWAGFAWASREPSCSLEAYLGPVMEALAPYGLEGWRAESFVTTELACNWKLSVDAHNEGYHVPSLHPEVGETVDDGAEQITLLGEHSRIVVPMGRPSGRLGGDRAAQERARKRVQREARRPEHVALSDDQLSDSHQFYVFPNLQLNVFADHALVFRHRPHATDPERCHFDQMSLTRHAGAEVLQAEPVESDDPRFGPVTGADLALLPELQRGIRSRGFRGGVLSRRERCIAHMHDALDRRLS
jgi:phenylpropionate dioxygenase-like ring-hydroxylating dioxygenase large terminal subunit